MSAEKQLAGLIMDADLPKRLAAENENLRAALRFCGDIAAEELPYTKVGTGAEVALRHIHRKARENLSE